MINNQIIGKRKNRKKALDLSQIKSFNINIRTITVEKIIKILNKPAEERDLEDYSILNTYILKISKITEKFLLDKIEQSAHEKIVLLSLPSSKLKIIQKEDSIIYNPENEANYLYIILRGGVKVLKVEKVMSEMNFYNYYKELIKYRNYNEKYLLSKTIEDNISSFPLDINDVPNLEKILLKIYIINHDDSNNDYDYLDKLIKKVGLKYSDFGLTCSYRDIIEEKNKKIILLNEILIKNGRGLECKELVQYDKKEAKNHLIQQETEIFKQLNFISYETCQKYAYFRNNTKILISLYKFKEDKILRNDDYFGDFLYGKYIHCVKSIQDNIFLLMIKNIVFKEFAKNEKLKITLNQVNFLTDNFFFRHIKKYTFEKFYLNLFEVENYKLGQKICDEHDVVENIYFIKEGRVKLTTNKSILELHLLIDTIKELVKNKKLDKKEINTNNNEIMKLLEDNSYYNELNNNFESMKKEINIKQNKHIITYQENQCLGFESFYYGLKYLYTGIANSDKVEIYKISKERLIKIFHEKNEEAYLDYSKKAEETILFLIKRFIKINNLMLNFYDKRININNDNSPSLNKSNEIDNNNSQNMLNEENKTTIIKEKNLFPIINYDKIVLNKRQNSINNVKKLPNLNSIEKNKFILNKSTKSNDSRNGNINIYHQNNSLVSNIYSEDKKNLKKSNIFKKIKLIKIKNPQKNFFELTNLQSLISIRDNKNSINKSISIDNSAINDSLKFKYNSFFKNKNDTILIKKLKQKYFNKSQNNYTNISHNNNDNCLSNREKEINGLNLRNMNLLFLKKNNNKLLIRDKLQKFINIKNKLMIYKHQIYKKEKQKLQKKFNNFNFSE